MSLKQSVQTFCDIIFSDTPSFDVGLWLNDRKQKNSEDLN